MDFMDNRKRKVMIGINMVRWVKISNELNFNTIDDYVDFLENNLKTMYTEKAFRYVEAERMKAEQEVGRLQRFCDSKGFTEEALKFEEVKDILEASGA